MDRTPPLALSHTRLWAAIDMLAHRHGLSASGLARKAGLNATTFNRSKRIGADGRPRWPSMESIAKVLEASGASLAEFFMLLGREVPEWTPSLRALPIIASASAAELGCFDVSGAPFGPHWDLIAFPALPATPNGTLVALDVSDDAFAPLYRAGDVLIVAPQADLRRGDRVLVRYRDGGLMVGLFRRDTLNAVEIEPVDASTPVTLLREDLDWVGRIVWVSQ